MKFKRTGAFLAAMLMAAGCASGNGSADKADQGSTDSSSGTAYKIGII